MRERYTRYDNSWVYPCSVDLNLHFAPVLIADVDVRERKKGGNWKLEVTETEVNLILFVPLTPLLENGFPSNDNGSVHTRLETSFTNV